LAGPGSAQTGNAGATGLAFLKIGVGARANAMGEAYTAVVSDATATFWNPAGLSRLQRGHVSFTHSEWIQDVSSEFLAVAFPAFGGVTGISANLSSVGSIERRVSTGESLGDLEWNDFALGVSYGRSISENLGVGVTAKYLYQKIYLDSASGYAFDLGFSFRPFANAITLALVAQNLGSVNELKAESSELPRTLRLGGSYVLGLPSLDGALVVAVDGVKIAEQDLRAHFGAEFQLKSMLALRMGYQAGYDEKSFGGGFGLTFQRYHLDYGYTPFGSNLGDTHRFSFGLDL
jgi:hypothetical protein